MSALYNGRRPLRVDRRLPVTLMTQLLGLMGLPGAGKSWLARELSKQLAWPILDRDRIRNQLFPESGASDTAKGAAENALIERMAVHLMAGDSVILDGMTLATHGTRRQWDAAARRVGAEWRLVFLDVPVELACRRVQADRAAGRHPAPDRDERLVRTVASRLERPAHNEAALRVTGSDTRAIVQWLQQSLRGKN